MKFDFTKTLQHGHDAAEQVIKNNNEIEEIFKSLAISLNEYLDLKIELMETVEYESNNKTKIFNPFEIKVKTGRNIISLRHEETDVSKALFYIIRSEHGYPITVILDRDNYVADNQMDFYAAISTVISNGQTNIRIREFKRAVERALQANA